MCQFLYHMFEQCSHCIINVAEYCQVRKWMAGIKRQLQPCPETKYMISRVVDRGEQWQVISGTCMACVMQPGRNAESAPPASQGDLTGTTIPMRPAKSMQDQRIDSLSPIPPEKPFISLPDLTATLPELLGFRDKLHDKTSLLFDDITFPARIMPYVEQTKSSWTMSAIGSPAPLESYFMDNGGLLVEDRKSIAAQKLWKDEKAIWE